jgi:hypothetical protein
MQKKLRVISINFPLESATVSAGIETENAFFDYDVVVLRPPQFNAAGGVYAIYQRLESLMSSKRRELNSLLAQGGLLVIFLDAPATYRVETGGYSSGTIYTVSNYDFLDPSIAPCVRKGTGTQVRYSDAAEPFVGVLKKSDVAWVAYIATMPNYPFNEFKFFAHVGVAGSVGGKMPYREGNIILLPSVTRLHEESFLEACAEYRFKRQGTPPPDWTNAVFLSGLPLIESAISELDKQIADLQGVRQVRVREFEDRAAYRKLLYEKGKIQLEPIVLRALDDLGFGTSPGEVIKGTNHEIDGRTSSGSSPGIVEVKGSKNQIVQSEFSPFVTKILADSEISDKFSKGILVGNGLCESNPSGRLGDAVFSAHVLDGAKRHSVALINSVELYWLCCALLRDDTVDKAAVRETILGGNGYVDLKLFCGDPIFTGINDAKKGTALNTQ